MVMDAAGTTGLYMVGRSDSPLKCFLKHGMGKEGMKSSRTDRAVQQVVPDTGEKAAEAQCQKSGFPGTAGSSDGMRGERECPSIYKRFCLQK